MAINRVEKDRIVLLFLFFLCVGDSSALESYAKYDVSGSGLYSNIEVHLSVHEAGLVRARRQANETSDRPASVGDTTAAPATAPPATTTVQAPATTTAATAPSTVANVASNSSVGGESSQPAASTQSPSVSTASTARPANIDPGSGNPFKDSNIYHDYHKYYSSEYKYLETEEFTKHWVELDSAVTHDTLSKGHRVAAVIPLKFNFSFYGHELTKVTVATGGFIYMSPFLHQWLTATQYIAPLMANFDPSQSTNSTIMYQSEADHIIIEWKNMYLKDEQTNDSFHFQATLYKDSSIKFAYKSVPKSVSQISSSKHPVKIGLSDAYYNDTFIPQHSVKRRTIYEYDKVELNQTRIISNSIVSIYPVKTCNILKTCEACSQHTGVDFECKWCNKIGRCSDGMDWYRQHWTQQGCKDTHTVNASACASLPKPQLPNLDPHDSSMYDGLDGRRSDDCPGGDCGGANATTAVVIIIIAFILILVGGVGTWVYYAYTHPTSKSGMWLMEHRPSQLGAKIKFWKNSNSSSAKYQTETVA